MSETAPEPQPPPEPEQPLSGAAVDTVMSILSRVGTREIAYITAHLHWGMSIKPTTQWRGKDRTFAELERRVLQYVVDRDFVEACVLTADIVQGGADYPAAIARLAMQIAVVRSLVDIATKKEE